ncbi:MAG: C-terminal binding protein [Candidatus Bipolaricaulia bacterium]
MARYKVVVTDYESSDLNIEREILSEIDAELIVGRCRTEDEVIEIGKDADGLMNVAAPITRRVIESLERCRVIARYGIGVDTIDIDAATERGIVVVNVPSFCEDEVSDHAMTLILTCRRKLFQYAAAVRAGHWSWRIGQPIQRLRGQTLGLVAFGKIAQRVAQRAQVFGLKVIAYDPYAPEERFEKLGVERVDLGELLETSDIVSVHTPLTEETRGLIGEAELARMKRSAYLINTSRGPVIDEEALYRALRDSQIAGAGLDVLDEEPPRRENPLFELENVIITPHVAGYSESSWVEVRTKIAQDVARVLKGKTPQGFVNPEVEVDLKRTE